MRKTFNLITLLLFGLFVLSAQEKNDGYKHGYALKDRDTIWCKVFFDSKQDYATKMVKLMIGDEEVSFYAGGTITGYGVQEDGKKYDFGTVDVEVSVADRRIANLYFVKKLAAGTIDFYEYTYSITTTKRTTVNGVEKPGSSTTSTQNYTNNYISKTDSTNPVLATPILLPSFRKKDLEPYLSDNTELFTRMEKRFSIKELIAIIKEYNNWSFEKKKTQ